MKEGYKNFGKPINRKHAHMQANQRSPTKELEQRVDEFAEAMKAKLRKKHKEGKRGWDDPEWDTTDIIRQLLEHIEKGDMVDVANFALFAWHKSA